MGLITLIAAMTKNRVIGLDGDLVVRLKEDMDHFKRTTMGHTVVMGRKTWDSLNWVTLSGRVNVVVSRMMQTVMPPVHMGKDSGFALVTDIEDALDTSNGDIFVIGGGEIYAQALEKADRIILTVFEEEMVGDTYFPEFEDRFELVSVEPLPNHDNVFIKTYHRLT